MPITAPPLGPEQRRLARCTRCDALSDTPLSEQQKLSTVLLVSGFVRNEATLTADFAAASGGRAGHARIRRHLLRSSPTTADFPALHRAIASGALDDDDDIDAEFDFGLERVLDGVEVLIERQRERDAGGAGA